MNVNKAMLVGRVTRDIELRNTQSGQSVASFSIATNNFWTDKSGAKQESTEFHNIVLWGRLAEIAGQYLVKGQEVYIEGRLQTRTYQAKDGTERRITEIVGESMQLGSRPNGHKSESAPSGSQSEGSQPAPKDDVPSINLDDDQEIKIEDVPF